MHLAKQIPCLGAHAGSGRPSRPYRPVATRCDHQSRQDKKNRPESKRVRHPKTIRNDAAREWSDQQLDEAIKEFAANFTMRHGEAADKEA